MTAQTPAQIHQEDIEWFETDEAWLAELASMGEKINEVAAGLESALKFVNLHRSVIEQYTKMVEASERILVGADLALLAREFYSETPDEATPFEVAEHESNERIQELLEQLHGQIVARQNAIISSVEALRAAIAR